MAAHSHRFVEEFEGFIGQHGTLMHEFRDRWHGNVAVYAISWEDEVHQW